MIVSDTGLCDDTRPFLGEIVNAGYLESIVKKYSGPAGKKKHVNENYLGRRSTQLTNERIDDLMPNKVENGSTKVNLYIYNFSRELVLQ